MQVDVIVTYFPFSGLEDRGHTLSGFEVGGSVVGAVARTQDGKLIQANADFRKAGGVAGF